MVLIYFHLLTVLPAFFIGGYILYKRKGTPRHRFLGKVYMILMLLTAVFSLGITSVVGPKIFGHFGFIHVFSVLVLYSVPKAYVAARNGNIKQHQTNMKSLYFLGVILAGGFAFTPGRLMNDWISKWIM